MDSKIDGFSVLSISLFFCSPPVQKTNLRLSAGLSHFPLPQRTGLGTSVPIRPGRPSEPAATPAASIHTASQTRQGDVCVWALVAAVMTNASIQLGWKNPVSLFCLCACSAADSEPVLPQPASGRAAIPLAWTPDASHPTPGRDHCQWPPGLSEPLWPLRTSVISQI